MVILLQLEFAQSSPCNYVIHPAIGLLTPGIPHAYNGTFSYILKYGSQSSAYWYKMPRFFNQTDYENSVNPNTVNALDSLVSSCDSFCIESAGNWIATLDSSCSLFSSLDTVDQDSARDYMIQVCEAACGDNHPYGASSQLPSNLTVYDGSHAFNSFEDVFNYFLFTKQSHAITYQDSGCSASEITFPPPYGITGTSEMGSTIIIQKDSCTCARITSYYQNYNTDVATLGSEFTTKCPSFLVYLDSIFNTQFTDTTVTILLNLCNNNSCDYLANPLVLPPQLSCGDCINCSQVEQQIDTFIHLYGCVSTVDTAKFNAMLTVYLNQVFGFNESYGQYMAFIKQCGEGTPKATVCSSPIPLPIGTLIIPAVKYPGNLWNIINNVAANPAVGPAQIIGIVSLPFSGSTGSLTLVTPGQAWNALETNTADTAVTIVVQFYNPLGNDSVNNYISKSPYTLSATTVKWIESNASVCTGLLNPLDSMQRDSTPPIFAGVPLVIDTTADTAGVEAPGLSSKGTVIFSSGADSTWCYSNPTLCGTPIFPVENAYQDTGNCRTELTGIAMANATQQYNFYLDSVEGAFTQNYIAHCMKAKENLTMQGSFNEYHYTLYYYDQAGNLEKTVPPNGVHPIAGSDTLAAAESYRNGTASAFQRPTQDYVTRYWYNTLNQMVKDSTPDGDTTHFWYDALGRLVVSQNSKQALLNEYSYTKYDAIGRIIEVGQTEPYAGSYPGPAHMNDVVARNAEQLTLWLNWGYRGQVTHTFYDAAYFTVPRLTQNNLRKRVASVAYYDTTSQTLTLESIMDSAAYTYATHYSYDPQGNVQTVVQDIPALQSVNNRYKRTDYDYDLQSGKVNYVYYENDSLDAFTQWYQYDQDLRLSNVMTSLDQVQWDNDASYNYYNHGPLARMELGERQVQGVDFAYTINGWQKGINSSTGLVKNDMGQDGSIGNFVGADVFGEVIGYYNNDYRQIKATTQPFELAYAGSNFDEASAGLYNGNIRNTTVALRRKLYYDDTDVSMSPIGYAYNYDQLNRYVSMRAYDNYDTATNSWQSGGAALQDYAENVTYDGNGNILTYIRHGNPTIGVTTGPTAMDSMTYDYNSNNNQLNSVADGVPSSNYSIDIDNEVGDNYKYDKQGNMIFDSSQHLTITWNVRNKVNTVYNDNSKLLITFGYDAMGNRIMKKDSNLSSHKCYTLWYERDAQGNTLGVYKERNDSMWWQESDIYGSSRVGVYYADSLIYPKGFQITTDTFKMELWEGKRQYELTNHLGNVLTTISDKKIMLTSNAYYAGGVAGARAAYRTISAYQPEVVSVSDYGPYGNILSGRNYSLADDTAFRYGFNGQERDDDIEGKGDLNTAMFWEYDTRLGRRWNLDPEPNAYESNYLAMLDNPLWHNDVLGNSVDGGPSDGQTASTNTTATGIGTTNPLQPIPVNNKPAPAQAGAADIGVPAVGAFLYQMYQEASTALKGVELVGVGSATAVVGTAILVLAPENGLPGAPGSDASIEISRFRPGNTIEYPGLTLPPGTKDIGIDRSKLKAGTEQPKAIPINEGGAEKGPFGPEPKGPAPDKVADAVYVGASLYELYEHFFGNESPNKRVSPNKKALPTQPVIQKSTQKIHY